MIDHITSLTHAVEVASLGRAEQWYTALLGRGPDLIPTEGVLEWQLLGQAWLQVSEGAVGHPGTQMLHIGVEDISHTAAELAQQQIDVGEIERIDGAVAFCEFEAPSATTCPSTSALTGRSTIGAEVVPR